MQHVDGKFAIQSAELDLTKKSHNLDVFSVSELGFLPLAILENCALSLSDSNLLAGKAGWSLILAMFRNLNSVKNACDLQLSERPLAPSLSPQSRGAAMGRCMQAALFAAL